MALRVGLGLVLLLVVFALPPRPGPIGDLRFPVEWFWIVGALTLVRGRGFGLLAALVLAFAASTTVLRLADWGTIAAFSRPFDPVVDRSILVAGWHLLSGTIGNGAAFAALGSAVVLFLCLVLILAYGLSGVRRLAGRTRAALGIATLAAGALATIALALMPADTLSVSAALSAYAGEKFAAARQSYAAQAAFAREVASDPLRDAPPERLLAALDGHDVLLVFVESYGRSAIENPLFAPRTLARLGAVEADLARVGVLARSGWLRSPVAGGQSWLAHGTMLSGLTIDNQTRYESLLQSDHESLNALFRGAGWRTVAVMPAITMPWPEAGWFRYDEILAAKDLDYRGRPFNWVTMPDQFTLLRIGEILQRTSQPVMLQTALISSHAPWTPIPTIVPWETIGDGHVFDAQATSGVAPEVLWRDPQRVRENYGLSIDYAIEAVGAFVDRFARDAVVIVVGDHQPAELVTGPDATRDVPLHILTADPRILDRLDGWGLVPGMVPGPAAPVLPMQDFRERFVRAMSGGDHAS
ncbi:sulfatase-like hydrolase/transferase [uncultured Aureimonas sp.]|uniref:sulfatase-like hydrolase/transferase n=1 Tax=uncultured Aureimonas sp. TaxID=1604662 RepID=UPI0025D4CE3C|nr:sulfatase-like hydrolase/transferase [uncultured Aureimonas sp.]